MAFFANPEEHAQAMRLARTTYLFGVEGRLMSRLQKGDYRGALMLCRKAMTREEHAANQQAAESKLDYRASLLELLRTINRLRLEMRSH